MYTSGLAYACGHRFPKKNLVKNADRLKNGDLVQSPLD